MSTAAFEQLPFAHGGPAGSARLRATPEDFIVREWLGFEADGEGEHWLLTVRKRDANTHWVAKQLARLAQVSPRDVGFAGLKDRDAVTEQAFTVPGRRGVRSDWVGIVGEGFEVIGARRHRRKLPRGALKGNDFEIVLRDFQGEIPALESRLAAIARAGTPNYFGPQRFGHGGANLARAERWFAEGDAPVDRVERGFALSAARSSIFNSVLARRVADGSWNSLRPGEVANLDGTGSVFTVGDIDEVLRGRCDAMDIHPTGPLVGVDGRAVRPAADSAGGAGIPQLEGEVIASHAVLAAGVATAGVEAARRALRVRVANLASSIEGDRITLRFRLSRGAFATAVLREIVSFGEELPEGDG